MLPLPNGRVAWYALGRFYSLADGRVYDAGYFSLLEPVLPADMFAGGSIGPGSAHFTFFAEPFSNTTIQQGALTVSIASVGDFTLYYQPTPQGDFGDPDSFSHGLPIAQFRRRNEVIGVTQGDLKLNTFSVELVASWPFEHGGRRYDLGEALANGVTQWGVGTGTPDPSAASFVGTAIAIGPEARR